MVQKRKFFEIEASTIELMGGNSSSSSSNDDGDILTFGEMESSPGS